MTPTPRTRVQLVVHPTEDVAHVYLETGARVQLRHAFDGSRRTYYLGRDEAARLFEGRELGFMEFVVENQIYALRDNPRGDPTTGLWGFTLRWVCGPPPAPYAAARALFDAQVAAYCKDHPLAAATAPAWGPVACRAFLDEVAALDPAANTGDVAGLRMLADVEIASAYLEHSLPRLPGGAPG